MPAVVLIVPILAGKAEAWRRFCQELSGSRLQMYITSRRRLGITHERLALVESAHASTAVTTLQAADIGRALGRLITSDLAFDRWYRERLQDLLGVSLDRYASFAQPAPGPPGQELLFEWTLQREHPRGDPGKPEQA